MLKRNISGFVYVFVLSGFFLLREFVDYRIFYAVISFFCILGTFEVARALKKYENKAIFVICIIYGVLFPAVYILAEQIFFKGNGYVVALIFTCFALIVIALFKCVKRDGSSMGEKLAPMIPVLYPSLFILTMFVNNEGENNLIPVLLMFVISALADTFAFLVGISYGKIRKGNAKKLCPKLSPNKTVAGAIGGLAGGVIGSFAVYLILRNGYGAYMPSIGIMLLIGFLGALFTEIGDLFESLIKRKVGLKDMGKIMPGHGGIMDRIDGICFNSALIMLIYMFI